MNENLDVSCELGKGAGATAMDSSLTDADR
jgi:hypothetical protein